MRLLTHRRGGETIESPFLLSNIRRIQLRFSLDTQELVFETSFGTLTTSLERD